MNNKIGNILISLAIAVVLEALFVVCYNAFGEGMGKRIFMMLGGSLPGGIVQFATFFLFIFGMLDIKEQNGALRYEEKGFRLQVLPEKENWVLSPEDVAQIKLQAIEISKRKKFIVLDLVKKACAKYWANKSTSEALDVLSAQVRINLANSESSHSMIRYVAWAIPSVGFIGTILGIASSLSYAGEAMSEDGIKLVTGALNVAFDTTLVALVLSLVLMLFIHILQEKTEKFHTKTESYIIENFINRIYK